MGILANENAISSGGYQISNSLRFQSASSQYLSRTPASTTNRRTFTWSAWIKKGLLGTSVQMGLFDAYSNGTNEFAIGWMNDDTLRIYDLQTTTQLELRTSAVYRDPSAWYHIVVAVDTTQATASNRAKLYVNGVQVTALGTATYPAQNYNTNVNVSTIPNWIGRSGYGYIDGYQTEINFIDGQALTPSSFGETNTLTGQWVAKKYTGTYGTNGFYLPFSNGTSTTTLGADSSGNGNNWTLTNFTRSAGVSDCWMYDVPSGNGSAGTQPNSNYAVFNPLAKGSSTTVSKANLAMSTGATWQTTLSSVAITSGKYYFEAVMTSSTNAIVGIGTQSVNLAGVLGDNAYGYSYQSNGNKWNNNSATAYGASWTTGDVIGIAYDADAGTITFYKNNVSQGVAFSSIPAGTYFFAGSTYSTTLDVNFGQRSFAYTPPSGFKALCTANLPASTIVKGNQYMDATLYTGTGSTQSITNAGGFSPDLVWLKKRGGSVSAQWHMLADTIRGTGATLSSNATDAEYTGKTSVTAFNSNGFTLGADSTGASYYGWNIASDTYVGWQWDAGSSTVTNTDGTISSQVRANPTAGFSIVTYTGNATTGATVGHGLGVAPKMVIYKNRNSSTSWFVYTQMLGSNYFLQLNSTAAAVLDTRTDRPFGTPTSSNLILGLDAEVNGSGNSIVAYCFAEIVGFSKFGSYTGNGSADGPFVYCGFRPKYVMVKLTNGAADWYVWDSVRDTYNVANKVLLPNSSASEYSGATFNLDLLSNGFKLRMTDAAFNGNGNTYIYMAFAEVPMAYANSR